MGKAGDLIVNCHADFIQGQVCEISLPNQVERTSGKERPIPVRAKAEELGRSVLV